MGCRVSADWAAFCLATDDGFICNGAADHDGDHEALGLNAEVCHAWPQTKPAACWVTLRTVTANERTKALWADTGHIYRIVTDDGQIHAPGLDSMSHAGTLRRTLAAAIIATSRTHGVRVQPLSGVRA